MEFSLPAHKQKQNPKAIQKPNNYLVKKLSVVPKKMRISRVLLSEKMFITLMAEKRSGCPQLLSSKRIV
jgi:hypothetical protein